VEGTPFGRYRLVELLGRGGMGEVWRAHDTATNNRIVAIKLLPPQLAADPTFVQRFRREADAAARLNNPHIIPIHNYGEIDGRLYVDMRLIEGRDLQEVLADGPLEPGRAVRIIEGVALALHAAHEVGLLHRDVKPSNILLDRNDFAYLIDFGIARAIDETRLTKSGNTIGTFQYIAPERLGTRTEEDARADIYSLACVLYECLTGHPPFDGETMAHLVAAHLSAPPPQPSTSQPNVPPEIDGVIATGMAKDPDQRYATTVELAHAAHDAITTPIRQPVPPTRPGTFEDREVSQSADTVLDYPDTPPPQQIPGPTLEATRMRPPVAAASEVPSGDGAAPTKPARPRRNVILAALALVGVIALVTVVVIVIVGHQTSSPHQVVLPFTGLNTPTGVAVDSAGNVYATDPYNNRVVKLAAGTTTQTVLPFTDLNHTDLNNISGVAVDSAGNVYVTDIGGNRVLKLAAGTTAQTVLPFTGLNGPRGVAVDSAGSLYVADKGNDRVLKLAAGTSTQTVLPFTDLGNPLFGVAVDGAGNVYVTDNAGDQVKKLAAGTTTQTVLPFTGLNGPRGVAVDSAGNLFVADAHSNRVLKLAAGSATQTVLPFTDLDYPTGVAVDSAGNVYVTDERGRVLKLPAG
jgi:serine/threonine-protein kinase